MKYFFSMRNREMLFPVFVQWLPLLQDITRQLIWNFTIQLPNRSPHPPPPPACLGNLRVFELFKGQVHDIVYIRVRQ